MTPEGFLPVEVTENGETVTYYIPDIRNVPPPTEAEKATFLRGFTCACCGEMPVLCHCTHAPGDNATCPNRKGSS